MWQNTHSQLFYPEYKEEKYLPPYDPNVVVVSPDVEKWVNEQLVNKDSYKKVVKMKTDVLGRVKSRAYSYKDGQEKVVENKQKRLVMVSDMHIREHEIESEHGRYEYNMETKKYDYFLNDKKMNEKEYLGYQNKSLEKFKQQKKGKRDLPVPGVINSDDRTWVAWMTAEEISKLTKNYKELAIDDYVEPKEAAHYSSILSSLQLPSSGGNGIGVYVSELNCVDPSVGIVNTSKYTVNNSCNNGVSYHHNGVVNIVQRASPLAHVFGFSGGNNHPSNPSSYSPPLEIGSHSYYYYASIDTFRFLYSTYDRNMDNYIYENEVINFVAAGNESSTHYVTSPGKAFNAITVGAIDPITNKYKDYSSWKNPTLASRLPITNVVFRGMGSDKPEIAMYTDIDHGYGTLGGTSAATPLAAGFTATLLDQHPFFKRHPALVKAVLLTGETIPIPYASSWDTDNSNKGLNASVVARGIVNYSSISLTRSAWWTGGNSAHFINKEIRFTEKNIQANKRYRIAIAWLVEGSFIYAVGDLPQDIDLYVEQDGQRIATSISARNSFEVVDFVTNSNSPLTIIIYRSSNITGDVLLGYHMREF
ncbi:MAG: S8 family serine peptidase [Fibromonadaceae bacterium]|jgi:hypothetical protein|nr:S8 family serine peptidase [Fibromonadaceae bacterium]